MLRLLRTACALALALSFASAPLHAQKVKTKAKKVTVDYLRQPTLPLPAEVRTYSANVTASGFRQGQLGGQLTVLENALAIPGYNREPIGDIHLELIPSAVSFPSVRARERKSKSGEVSYVPTAFARFDARLRILGPGAEVLYEEHFGPMPGTEAPAGEVSKTVSPGLAGYDGTPVEHESTKGPLVVEFDKSFATQEDADKDIRKRYDSYYAPGVESRAVKMVADAVSARLQQMGFQKRDTQVKLQTLKEGHPETEAVNAAVATLVLALGELGPGADLAAVREQAAAPVAYFAELMARPTADDKQAEKLRDLATDNYVLANAFLEQADALQPVFASLSDKAVRRYRGDYFPLQDASRDRLAASPHDSRYDATHADDASLSPPPADVDPEAYFGLLTSEVERESLAEQIGRREDEVEYDVVATHSETGLTEEYRGLITPRVVVGSEDGKEGLKRFMASSTSVDPQIILSDNVRAYRILADGTVDFLDFTSFDYDHIAIGDRVFVRPFDKKMPDGGRLVSGIAAMAPSPVWYEVAYESDVVTIYQHAWTPIEIDAYELDEATATYAFAIGDAKLKHTSSELWMINPVKRITKAFDCPAVSAFVDEEKPGMHYYTLIRMAELYEASTCAGK